MTGTEGIKKLLGVDILSEFMELRILAPNLFQTLVSLSTTGAEASEIEQVHTAFIDSDLSARTMHRRRSWR